MRRRSFIVIFVLAVIAIIYVSLQGADSMHDTSMGSLYSEDFKKLSREDQIKKCAKCHASEYEEELSGPHAAAFVALSEYKQLINHPDYPYPFYTKFVNNTYDNSCVNCHSADDLFRTILKDHNKVDSLTTALLACAYPHLSHRPSTGDRKTGVDCLSCHFDGKGVLSGNEKFKNGGSAICNPTYSAFFKNTNMTCYPCHYDEVKSLSIAVKEYNCKNTTCNGCHVKNDPKGIPTHYYYWTKEKHNDDHKMYYQMTNDFSFHKASEGHSQSYIKWTNKAFPHILSLCPELIFDCQVMNKDSVVIGKTKFRINRKNEHDKMMYETFDKKTLGGTLYSQSQPHYSEDRTYSICVSHPDDAKYLKITINKKAQYWFEDSTAITTISRITAIR